MCIRDSLNAVCHVVDGAGKLHDIFPVTGGQELTHKLFHRAVTDSIEDVLLRLYMFNIRTLRPEAQAFAPVSYTHLSGALF